MIYVRLPELFLAAPRVNMGLWPAGPGASHCSSWTFCSCYSFCSDFGVRGPVMWYAPTFSIALLVRSGTSPAFFSSLHAQDNNYAASLPHRSSLVIVYSSSVGPFTDRQLTYSTSTRDIHPHDDETPAENMKDSPLPSIPDASNARDQNLRCVAFKGRLLCYTLYPPAPHYAHGFP